MGWAWRPVLPLVGGSCGPPSEWSEFSMKYHAAAWEPGSDWRRRWIIGHFSSWRLSETWEAEASHLGCKVEQ